jgi:hypothetical protein
MLTLQGNIATIFWVREQVKQESNMKHTANPTYTPDDRTIQLLVTLLYTDMHLFCNLSFNISVFLLL